MQAKARGRVELSRGRGEMQIGFLLNLPRCTRLHRARASHPSSLESSAQEGGGSGQFRDGTGPSQLGSIGFPQHGEKRFCCVFPNTFGVVSVGIRLSCEVLSEGFIDSGRTRRRFSCGFFVLARSERYHSWISVGHQDGHAQRTEYLLVRLHIGVKRTRRLGPQVIANINSGFYRGKQFSRCSRPGA